MERVSPIWVAIGIPANISQPADRVYFIISPAFSALRIDCNHNKSSL
jgi:hypothetical protein